MDKNKTLPFLINICFFLYFIILIVERTFSVVLSFVDGINIFANGFNTYVYLLVFVSILGWLVYMLIRCRKACVALFKNNVETPFVDLCIASGILLLSGMVHTERTIPVVQFISYGILIVGILLKVIMMHKETDNKLLLWLSFVYLVCFSMAIPVVYHSLIELHILFHVLEGVTSFVLVGIFTYLLILIFKGKNNLVIIWPIIIAVILDAALIVLRWKEEINFFVLIFISLSLIMFVIGYVVSIKHKQHK